MGGTSSEITGNATDKKEVSFDDAEKIITAQVGIDIGDNLLETPIDKFLEKFVSLWGYSEVHNANVNSRIDEILKELDGIEFNSKEKISISNLREGVVETRERRKQNLVDIALKCCFYATIPEEIWVAEKNHEVDQIMSYIKGEYVLGTNHRKVFIDDIKKFYYTKYRLNETMVSIIRLKKDFTDNAAVFRFSSFLNSYKSLLTSFLEKIKDSDKKPYLKEHVDILNSNQKEIIKLCEEAVMPVKERLVSIGKCLEQFVNLWGNSEVHNKDINLRIDEILKELNGIEFNFKEEISIPLLREDVIGRWKWSLIDIALKCALYATIPESIWTEENNHRVDQIIRYIKGEGDLGMNSRKSFIDEIKVFYDKIKVEWDESDKVSKIIEWSKKVEPHGIFDARGGNNAEYFMRSIHAHKKPVALNWKDRETLVKLEILNTLAIGNWVDGGEVKKVEKRDLSFVTDPNIKHNPEEVIIKKHPDDWATEMCYNEPCKNMYVLFAGLGENPEASRLLKERIKKQWDSYIQYTFEFWLLNANPQSVVDNFKFINSEFNRFAKWFDGKLTVVGTSIWGISAFMAANNNPYVKNLVLIDPGDRLSKSMWDGLITQHIRESMEKHGTNLEELQEIWHDIEPINNLDGLWDKKITIYNSKSDGIIPYERSEALVREMKKNNLAPDVNTNSWLGHLGTIGSIYYKKKYLKSIQWG